MGSEMCIRDSIRTISIGPRGLSRSDYIAPGGCNLGLCIVREGGPNVGMEVHAGFGLNRTVAALTTFAFGFVILPFASASASTSAPSLTTLPPAATSATTTTSTALSEPHLAFLVVAGPVQLMVGDH